MLSLRLVAMTVTLLGAACVDDPTQPGPVIPPATQDGINAYVTVDNLHALPGETVRVSVEVRLSGTAKVGSYTGRLHFDPAQLALKTEVPINDGLRVSNPKGATQGELRFAGANPTGFTSLTLYSAQFVVHGAGYANTLSLRMEELSAARTLVNLAPRLQVSPQVYLKLAH